MIQSLAKYISVFWRLNRKEHRFWCFLVHQYSTGQLLLADCLILVLAWNSSVWNQVITLRCRDRLAHPVMVFSRRQWRSAARKIKRVSIHFGPTSKSPSSCFTHSGSFFWFWRSVTSCKHFFLPPTKVILYTHFIRSQCWLTVYTVPHQMMDPLGIQCTYVIDGPSLPIWSFAPTDEVRKKGEKPPPW